MHLVFVGHEQRKLLNMKTVERLLREQSVKVDSDTKIGANILFNMPTKITLLLCLARKNLRQPKLCEINTFICENLLYSEG
jgi:hypothetical protein